MVVCGNGEARLSAAEGQADDEVSLYSGSHTPVAQPFQVPTFGRVIPWLFRPRLIAPLVSDLGGNSAGQRAGIT